jgi:signal transduction histidine kinase
MNFRLLGSKTEVLSEPVAAGFHSTIDSAADADDHRAWRWMGWRLRLLVIAALLGCVTVLWMARWLANEPSLPASWRGGAQGQIELASASDAQLKPQEGRTLIGLIGSDNSSVAVIDALVLQRSPRWITNDAERDRYVSMHAQLSSALANDSVKLFFSEGEMVELKPEDRGATHLGAMFWLLSGLALTLYLVGMVVLLARPGLRNLLYALLALFQAGNLAFMAIESSASFGLPMLMTRWDMPVRMAFDLLSAAAVMHIAAVHPRRLPGASGIALLGWLTALTIAGLGIEGRLPGSWWWTQSMSASLTLVAIGLSTWSYRLEPHPFAIVMQRFSLMTLGTWVLLSVALTAVDRLPSVQQQIAAVGPMVWYVFLASLLLLTPFVSKSQQVMREFSLLAAISTVATSLDLLFAALFSMGQFASVTLALFVTLGIYSGARQWLLNQLRSSSVLTTERMFESLYRVAREVEARPDRSSSLLMKLLRELFEPLEAEIIEKHSHATRVLRGGSTLLVPVPDLTNHDLGTPQSVLIRFGQRGRRLFTSEDARLTDRVVEQLRRAVAYDSAVEQGRSEERSRLAQDLHDDIGARLLTLMYKAQSPEMEDYVRHTLQDLKTLTRGLAAPNHPLSHAAAEWKTDLTQRLTVAHITLDWSFSMDSDVFLTVVQWSGLTRVIRELVSNVIAHSKATHLDVELQLENDRFDLSITDDGIGSNPKAWSHGLGLGGVRKRVKQLGGEVEWREVVPTGICCRMFIRQLTHPG